jgi:uncharacterized YccA/Bax inhibitor family protein
MANPAYSRNKGFMSPPREMSAEELQAMYNAPAASATRAAAPATPQSDSGAGSTNTVSGLAMSIEGTMAKTFGMFALLVVGAAGTWTLTNANPAAGSGAMIIGGLLGFVLAMVNIFKREPSAPLILMYSLAQGVFLGALSALFDAQWNGIVFQAVLATLTVVGVTLALFASGKVRASAKGTKVFLIAMVGYLLFSVINMFLVMFGAIDNPWGLSGISVFGIPLGVIIGIFAVLLGAYSLVLDFEFIRNGVANRMPAKYEWTGGFGIMVTVIWLYTEILRLLAISRN